MRINSHILIRRPIGIALILLCCRGILQSQEWIRMEVSEPAKKSKYTQFILQGKFLQAPQGLKDTSPKMILNCQSGRFSSGHLHGKLLSGVLHVGATVDDSPVRMEVQTEPGSNKPDPGGYYVEYKLDDREVQTEHWDNLQNYQQVGFGSQELNKILWGQISPRKENSIQQVRKLAVKIQRYSNEVIMMQFDMPDATEVSELCGCTYFAEKK